MITSRILIVDDEDDIRFMIQEVLSSLVTQIDMASDGMEAIQKVAKIPYDLVILDLKMPRMDGMETLQKIKELDSETTVIMMTAHGTRETAMTAINQGCYDYFEKPFDIEEMRVVVRRALEKSGLQKELKIIKQEEIEELEGIIGTSLRMQDVFRLIKQVANLDITVMIVGESGTGKELVAKEIHQRSNRANKPFIRMNCAAIPEGLLESELFGHERGSFTGASEKRPGKFEIADGGTIFLDEIGDMSMATQAKLLRILQEREFERVGGNKPIKVDIRVIAATNQDLVKMVQEKTFREDLYFRLNVIQIALPPVRERSGDLALLLEHFLKMYNTKFGKNTKVSPTVLKFINEYTWPGNVREFENFIQRAVALAPGDLITEEFLPVKVQDSSDSIHPGPVLNLNHPSSLSDQIKLITEEAEKKMIIHAIHSCNGNRSASAKLLGLSRKSLYDKLSKYKIDI